MNVCDLSAEVSILPLLNLHLEGERIGDSPPCLLVRSLGRGLDSHHPCGGNPRPACFSFQSSTRNLVAEQRNGTSPAPALSSFCAVFAVSPVNSKPTSDSSGSPHMCFGWKNAPAQAKIVGIECSVGCSSQGLW